MRLQLIMAILCCLFTMLLHGQQPDSTQILLPDSLKASEPVDAHFLMNYYKQDGDHAAVTGGKGTEELRDIASRIIINIPVDSITRIAVDAGMNNYSSASTDRIDNNISSASSEDNHVEVQFGYERDVTKRRMTYGLSAGASIESDYVSTSFGGSWSKTSKDGNREFNIRGQVFLDRWDMIFPIELRDVAHEQVHTDKRRSYSGMFSLSQVLNRRMEALVTAELVYQHGLLSTPFHRVYFQNEVMPRVEKLPENRWKYPLGLRLNYFVLDWLVLRGYYRFYADDFGIVASTASLEVPVKFSPYFTLFPFYRYHTQTASEFFAPFAMHWFDEEFYTSDYDLSALSSSRFGLGFRYSPLTDLFQLKLSQHVIRLKSLELRYTHYQRNEGLEANMGTLHLAFTIP